MTDIKPKVLGKALETQAILKRMKKSVNRDAALAKNQEVIDILADPGVSVIIGSEGTAPTLAVDLPLAPQSYSIPGGATSVSTGAQLVTALAGTTPIDIVCENGTYTHTTFFHNPYGHRIYARSLGGCTSTSGFSFTGGNGGILRGFALDITSTTKCDFNGCAIVAYNTATNVSILDTTVHGRDVCNWGIRAVGSSAVTGLIIQRVYLQHFKWDGIRIVQSDTKYAYHDPTVKYVTTLSDIDIDYVYLGAGQNHFGTGEFGLWIQQPVTNPVNRVRIKNCYWGGVNTLGNSWDTQFTNFTVACNDGGTLAYYGTAFYLEHWNQNNSWDRFKVTKSGAGHWGEYDDPAWGGTAAIILPCSISNGTYNGAGVPKNNGAYNTGSVGMNYDGRCAGPTVSNVEISNMNWAAIGHHANHTLDIVSGGGINVHDCPIIYTEDHKSVVNPSNYTAPFAF